MTDRDADRDPFDPALFDRVDRSVSPDAFVAFLDAIRARPNSQRVRDWSADRLHLGPGDLILDLGCGTGTDLVDAASVVAPDGGAVGLDVSWTIIAEARRRTAAAAGVAVVQGAGETLPFRSEVFAGCRLERVLLHAREPSEVVAQIHRVLAPGGRVTIVEPDFAAWFVDSSDPELDALVVGRVNRQQQPGVGRTLFRLLVSAGFTDVDVSGHVAVYEGVPGGLRLPAILDGLVADGMVERERIGRYLAAIADAHAKGLLFSAVPTLWAFAIKPPAPGS